MSVFYGKVRIYGEPGQTITITDGKGNSRTVQTTGTTYTDIALPGMEEYTLSNGVHSADILLNIGDFKEVTISVPTLEELTWAQVKSSIQDGTFAQFASVGDTKSFVMNGKTYHAEVVSINDGTGDAAQWYPEKTVDFICTELYETGYQYNSSATSTGGFPSSALRGTLINTLYPLLPSDLKDVIIEKSHSYITSTSGAMGTDSTKLWLPTHYEITGTTNQYAPGETASNNKAYTLASKIKNLNGQSYAYVWWLGSLYSYDTMYFWFVNTNENLGGHNASIADGVPICFRIG